MAVLEIDILFIFLTSIASFFACFLATIAGGGAGLILLPILLLTGLPFPTALASHKLAVGFIGVGSGYRFIKEGLVDWKVFWWTALCGLPFVVSGAFFAGFLTAEGIKPILGIIIICMVLFSLFKNKSHLAHSPILLTKDNILKATVILIPIAFYSGWISAGAGIFTTYLYLLYFKYDQLHATAMTMSANGIFWNMSGAVAHIFLGHVMWPLAPGLIIGALFGSYLGASLGIKKGSGFLRKVFLAISGITGMVLICR